MVELVPHTNKWKCFCGGVFCCLLFFWLLLERSFFCRCQNVHFQHYMHLCFVLFYCTRGTDLSSAPSHSSLTIILSGLLYSKKIHLFPLFKLFRISLFLLRCISQVSERHLCALNVEWRWCLVVLKQACLSAVWIQTETYWFLLYEEATCIQRKAHTHLLADAHSLFQNYSSAYMDKDMSYIII